MAGFEVFDVCMADLIQGKVTLDDFRGIVFVGGFSYSDVFGAGVGWYNVIKSNKKVSSEFKRFKNRSDTFSFGVCNGCQLMSLLGWIDCECRFVENNSERFESRYSNVIIKKSSSIMLKGMEGCVLGVWVAHKEGKFVTSEDLDDSRAPIKYVNNHCVVTEEYPFNPNGSMGGITSVCSKDGRHLAMMPHPERCFLNWQQPYLNEKAHDKYYPWMCMFYNAYKWCTQ